MAIRDHVGWQASRRAMILMFAITGLAGCASIRATTYAEKFDPPRTFLGFLSDRVAPDRVERLMVERGVDLLVDLGFDVEFETALDSKGCNDICYVYRVRGVDDTYLVLAADTTTGRFRDWFHFSPLESGSP